MDITNITNVGGKYILNPSQYHKMKNDGVVNPFVVNNDLEPVYVMKKQDFAVNHHNVVTGEGGLGSGERLEKRFGKNKDDPEMKERRYAQIKNAQRKYRSKSKNREKYNEYMRKLYHTMAKKKEFIANKPSNRFGKTTHENKILNYDTPEEWYSYRLTQARKANAIYREKKKAQKVISNLDNIIEKELKEKFKKEFSKRGRPSKKTGKKVFDPDSAWYKENYEKLKLEKQSELANTGTIMPYKLRQKKTQPEYPLGRYKTNKDGVNELITAIDDKPIDDRKEYDADATAYKKKREKPKAPPVVSEKKKSPFTPKENITVTVSEVEEPFKPKAVQDTKDFKDWFARRYGFKNATYEQALSTQRIPAGKAERDKALRKYIALYENVTL